MGAGESFRERSFRFRALSFNFLFWSKCPLFLGSFCETYILSHEGLSLSVEWDLHSKPFFVLGVNPSQVSGNLVFRTLARSIQLMEDRSVFLYPNWVEDVGRRKVSPSASTKS